MKKNLILLILIFTFSFLSLPQTAYCSSVQDANVSNHPTVNFTDNAKLVSEDEAIILNEDLIQKSNTLNFDIVIVTTNDLQGKTARDFCDDWYDYNHYGLDEVNSGICLLRYIKDDQSDYELWISTTGEGIWMFSDREIDEQIDLIADNIIAGNYNAAFTSFAENAYNHVTKCMEYKKNHITEDDHYNNNYNPYDQPFHDPYYDYHPGKEPLKTEEKVIICLIISATVGLVFALIMIGVYKSQLKSVSKAHSADGYVKRGSFALTHNRDIFLYKNVSKTAIPKSSSGSGHSSTHIGSSGISHGGGGRHI